MADTKQVQGQNAGSSTIQSAVIISKTDTSRQVNVAGGFIQFRYYESILQDGIQATYMFADAGRSIDKKTVSEGLPLNGGETFTFSAKDNNDTELKIEMVVGKTTSLSEETTKSLVILPLSSKAYAVNDTQNVRKFFPKQKISDHVKTLMTDFLKTEKTLDVEETSNTLTLLPGIDSINNLGLVISARLTLPSKEIWSPSTNINCSSTLRLIV